MINISSATGRLLALSMLKGVGPATLRKVARLPNFDSLPIDELASKLPPLARVLSEVDAWNLALDAYEKQLEAANQYNARILSPLDSEYPSLLSATKDDPFILFVRGKLAGNSIKSVAIIGTREPTAHGEVIAKRITEFFVDQQWSVVSGLALGCDALAHRAALEANGHTVAVLAHGLHTIAPSQHRSLAQQILDSGGALVSEYRFGQGVQPQQFVKRDRTQAGLAQGVVMIQSDIKGGSLHASRATLDYDRWLAVPFPTSVDRSNNEPKVQANLLIAEGAWVERASLLKCHQSKLERVIILKARDDYSKLIDASSIHVPRACEGVSVEPTLEHSTNERATDDPNEPAIDGCVELLSSSQHDEVNDASKGESLAQPEQDEDEDEDEVKLAPFQHSLL